MEAKRSRGTEGAGSISEMAPSVGKTMRWTMTRAVTERAALGRMKAILNLQGKSYKPLLTYHSLTEAETGADEEQIRFLTYSDVN